MMKLVLSLFLLTSISIAKERVVGILYFNQIMGHVHKSASRTSTSLTTIQCAHGLKVIESDGIATPAGWLYVKAGEDKGFIKREFLSAKRPECFQGKYPKFFNSLNLDLTDMYYWGRLFDQYNIRESRVR